MEFFIFSLILLSISIFLFIKTQKIKDNNNEILSKQQLLEEQNKQLEDKKEKAKNDLDDLYKNQDLIRKNWDATKENMNDAFMQFHDLLISKYKLAENEYDDAVDALRYAYDRLQDEFMDKIKTTKEDLDKIYATRIAAQEAILREQEIEKQSDFYCLSIKQEDLDDIQTLERIKPKLHKPRILCMLIWSTYYQKPMTALCNNIIGVNKKSGIYKITNQKTKQCYIGQAVDIATRWKDHAKCGLGIDTPVANKLYKAMQEYGLENFSFEILEECNKDMLNEKEKYYIELYQAYEYGYNSNAGIKSKVDLFKNL